MNISKATIKIKDVIHEDFVNYKKPSMFIITSSCNFKCEKEDPNVICHNSNIINRENKDIIIYKLAQQYVSNPITKAIVLGGLEPIDQFEELVNFIHVFRNYTSDDIVIYTGYTEDEIINKKYLNTDLSILDMLIYTNRRYCDGNLLANKLIIKYGRFKTNSNKVHDNILGVDLASSNQYAKLYSLGEYDEKNNE